MTKKQKDMLKRILVTAVLYVALVAADHMKMISAVFTGWKMLFLYLIPYFVIGWDILYKAVRNIKNGQVFDENFLMAVATIGAFGVNEYSEAVAVMLFYQVGELFQSYAVNRSRQSITDLMDICPEYANIEEDGQLKQVDPDDVEVGDIIVIKPGEKIPLDGKVVFGESMVDTSALTGESVPRRVKEGDDLVSGCVNGNGLLRAEVTKEFDDSTVAKILELAENLIRLSGLELDKDITIQEIGLRPGEKLYEELLMRSETLSKTSNEKIFIEQQQDISKDVIMDDLLRLDEAVTRDIPPQELITMLREMVPTYTSPEEINGRATAEVS